jgi:hypothetical protein
MPVFVQHLSVCPQIVHYHPVQAVQVCHEEVGEVIGVVERTVLTKRDEGWEVVDGLLLAQKIAFASYASLPVNEPVS